MTSLNSTPDEPFDPFDQRQSALQRGGGHPRRDRRQARTHRHPVAQTDPPATEWFRMHPGRRLHLAGCDVRQGGRKGRRDCTSSPARSAACSTNRRCNPCGCGWRSIVLAHRSSGR